MEIVEVRTAYSQLKGEQEAAIKKLRLEHEKREKELERALEEERRTNHLTLMEKTHEVELESN